MAQTHVYTDAALPADLECQAVSFIRMQWPFVFDGDNRFGRRIRTGHDPIHETEAPTRHERQRMMLFISPKGQAGRNAFVTAPLYIGKQAW